MRPWSVAWLPTNRFQWSRISSTDRKPSAFSSVPSIRCAVSSCESVFSGRTHCLASSRSILPSPFLSNFLWKSLRWRTTQAGGPFSSLYWPRNSARLMTLSILHYKLINWELLEHLSRAGLYISFSAFFPCSSHFFNSSASAGQQRIERLNYSKNGFFSFSFPRIYSIPSTENSQPFQSHYRPVISSFLFIHFLRILTWEFAFKSRQRPVSSLFSKFVSPVCLWGPSYMFSVTRDNPPHKATLSSVYMLKRTVSQVKDVSAWFFFLE